MGARGRTLVPLVLLVTTSSAFAQAPSVASGTSTTGLQRPFDAHLSDPMLASPERPSIELETWNDAVETLEARSTDLRIVESELARAEGQWRQSLSRLLPNAALSAGGAIDLLHPDRPTFGGTVGLGAQNLGQSDAPTVPLGTASITLSQALVDVSAWYALEGSGARERSAAADLQDFRRRVTQSLAQTLIAVVAAERAAEINRSNLRAALERVALTERTFELGAASRLDVIRVRQDVAVARSALISGDEDLRRTREALGLVLGIPDQVGVTPSFALNGLVDETKRRCRSFASDEDRSDVVAARERIAAARAERTSAKSGYLPRLGLNSTAFAYTTEQGLGRVAIWNVGAVLSLPLWEGGFREGLVEERSALASQAEENAEAIDRAVQIEVARARRGTRVAAALLATATEARDLAHETDELTRRSFQIGRADSLELVQSAAVLRAAELDMVLTEFEWVRARLDAFLTEARCDI